MRFPRGRARRAKTAAPRRKRQATKVRGGTCSTADFTTTKVAPNTNDAARRARMARLRVDRNMSRGE
jgi:hypothetical protein